MSFEQSQSETRSYHTRRENRQQISGTIAKRIDGQLSREKEEQRMKERIETLGKGVQVKEFINKGRDDRLVGEFHISELQDEKQQTAYSLGFYENGTRALQGHIDSLTPEKLLYIGRNDFYAGIAINNLPEEIKNNEYYSAGYNSAVMDSIMNSDKAPKKGGR